jgi:tetratricopeptide (TPR) repeat protein
MNQVSLGEYREEAAALVNSGQYAAAQRAAQHILDHYPDYIQGRQLLGRALLGAGCLLDAAAQFSWVLSCDPESAGARLGLARVHRALGNADVAQTYLERAFDLFPGDADLRREMNDLLDSDAHLVADQREMTRAALARIYARNGLGDKAIQEFEAVLEQEPNRYDVLLALAETLWRHGRHVEAVTVCHRVLDALPHALKANLIVGAAWLTSPQPEEAQPYLAVAQALDPENTLAETLFGAELPFPAPSPMIERLAEPAVPMLDPSADTPANQAELPTDRKLDFNGEETAPMSDQSRPEEDFEIPDWLQGVGDELLAEDSVPAYPPGVSPSPDVTPDWLRALVSRADDAASEGASAGEDEDNLALGDTTPGIPVGDMPDESEAAEIPEWLRRIAAGEAVAGPEPAAATPTPAAADAETDDWLNQLSAMRTEAAAAVDDSSPGKPSPFAHGPGLDMPDVEVEPTDLPDWLRETPVSAAAGEEAASVAELPDWLREQERTPSHEPATASSTQLPDWLKAVAAGTPVADADRGSVEAEPAALTSEPVDELPEWLRDVPADIGTTEAIEHAVPSGEPAAPVLADELPEWLRPIAEGEVAPEGEPAAAQAELSAWLTEDTTPAELAVSTEREPSSVMAEAESSIPDWLRELQEPRTESVAAPPEPIGVADLAEPEEPTVDASDAGLPEWLRRLRTGVAEEAPPLGTRELEADLAALSIVEPAGGEPAADSVPLSVSLPDTAGVGEATFRTPPPEPMAEVSVPAPEAEVQPATVDEAPATAVSAEQQPIPAAPVEELLMPAPAEAIIAAVEEAAAADMPAQAPMAEVVVPPIEELPRDAAERLTMARAAAMSSWSQALAVYESLVSSADLLSTVIADLEEGIRKHPDDYAGYQLVGDAYMKDGRLPDALRAYRTALTKLHR